MGANTTALRRSLPASHMLASQPASNSPSEYVTPHTKHQTSNIRIQSTLEHSSPISTSNTHSPISPQPPFINRYSINWLIKHIWINENHDSGSGITGTLFFVVFVGNCYKFDICSPYIKSMWINIGPEKSFQSIRSLSTQSSSQSHTRFIYFLTFKYLLYEIM